MSKSVSRKRTGKTATPATRAISRATKRAERRQFGRLRQLPSGRWQAAYVGPDSQVHKAGQTFGAKIDAEGWLAERRREIDRELWSPPATDEQKLAKQDRELTFGDYSRTWLETRKVKNRPLRPRTKEHYQRLLDQHLLPAFGRKPLRSISPDDVDRWYESRATDAPTLRAHCYSLLSTILDTARKDRRRLIAVNPCMIDGAATTATKVKPKPATAEQLDLAAAAMPERLALMVQLGGWCALRFGELVELRRKDIDKDCATIAVRRGAVRVNGQWEIGPPKSDAGIRDVAIPPHIAPAVKAHLAKHVDKSPDALLFPATSGGHLQPSTLYRHWYRAREAAERPDLRFHDLRHSGATLAAQTGATLAELMGRLGHSTPAAAMRYQHAAADRDREIAAKLSKLAAESKRKPSE